jgi:hypothetical protein
MKSREVTLCQKNADCVIGYGAGLAVAVWRYHTNAEDVPELATAARRAHAASGHPVGLVQIVPATAITPDGPARAALARMLRELGGVVASSAIVHEADGFRAAMIRSIVTGLTTLSNPGYPHRVFAKLTDAAVWMSQGNGHIHAEDIALIVRQLRAGAGIRDARTARSTAPSYTTAGR